MVIYRARLNGGSAPLDLAADLKRGVWTPAGYTSDDVSPTIDSTSDFVT